MPNLSRRRTLCALGAAAGFRPPTARAATDPWAAFPDLLKRIQPPSFPDRDFDVTRYGAKDGGKVDNTPAFQKAIETANAAGGGRVVVPAGVWLTGAIHLKSNVNLFVAADATVRFNPDPRLYPMVLTRFEGMECMNFSPFVYALGQRNIAITGGGTLDGQAGCEHWWPWSGKARCGAPAGGADQKKARAALMDLAERGVPVEKRVMGEGSYLRPMFVQPYRCANVLIEGVTIANSPMYELHPVLSKNVTVRHVTVVSHGPNNDGCDPESCADVLIDGCVFDTGDDCIAIKSGRNADGRRLNTPSENIVVQGCTMKDGHGGVTLGSECSGGIRNVYAQDCRMDSPSLDRVLRIKTNAIRGGAIEHVYMRNVEAGQVAGAAIDIDFYYEEGEKGAFPPVVRDIEVVNLTCRKSKSALSLRGFKSAPIRNVRLRNCKFEQVAAPNVVENVEGLTMDAVTINGRPTA
ncbi:MAG TPA: glycoside hydrolase family 28 protein [Candidatus Solibacter sp.]|nr:glycoside hydrolase family 28 protein [Candidatus Solibacter sp.]